MDSKRGAGTSRFPSQHITALGALVGLGNLKKKRNGKQHGRISVEPIKPVCESMGATVGTLKSLQSKRRLHQVVPYTKTEGGGDNNQEA